MSAVGGTAVTSGTHPLDPLDADEIRRAVATIRADKGVDSRWRVASIALREPDKDALSVGGPVPREVELVAWSRDDGRAFKAVVSLDEGHVATWAECEGVQPGLTPDEDGECARSLRSDPKAIEALAQRGITDMAKVHFEVWGLGADEIAEAYRGRRVAFIDVWHLPDEGANPYASAVAGLHFFVDLNELKVLEVEDSFQVEQPVVTAEYVPERMPGLQPRQDLRPLEITQPDGPSFSLEGRLLRWQRWSMRIGWTAREGLVLHTVAYEDEGRDRPIARRLSLAELVSPYRDPSPDHRRRMAYDAGEWGLGTMANSLSLGCDCVGDITYLDAVTHDSQGEPATIENAICIHEEDDGVLWKHVDPFTREAEVRRRRRLVLSFHTTIANYDYLVYWSFHLDGTIECEVRATGIVISTPFEGEPPPYGGLVDERTYAPYHQHFVVARLDMAVDGEHNSVEVSELKPLGPTEADPDGLAVVGTRRRLRTEAEAKLDYDWSSRRSWLVVNDNVTNKHGLPVAYRLVPEGCVPPMLDASSGVLRRASAVDHALWVTAYDAEERFPCGEFLVAGERDTGLPQWTAKDRPLENADVVLWHVFGLFHEPRTEDWPVMPTESTSFALKPAGFFDRNPALDVPRGSGHCSPND